MKKLSRILVLVLSLAIICGALAIAVNANSGTNLADIIDATKADSAGKKTVKLNADVFLDDMYIVGTDLTIDLNGHKLTCSEATAFSVSKNVSFSIIGKGRMDLEGGLVTVSDVAVDEKNPTAEPKVTIGSDNAVIEIYHSGTSGAQIFSAYRGTFNFKNLKVVSDFEADGTVKYSALFETVYKTTGVANMTFDGVEISHTAYQTNNFFLVSIAGKGSHLTIRNSSLYTKGSGIFLGEVNAIKEIANPEAEKDSSAPKTITVPDKEGEVLLFENSSLRCVAEYETQHKWGFCMEGYNFSTTSATIGVVNIKDSFVEVAGRPFYAQYPTVESIASTVNLINSEARCIGSNGSSHAEIFARWTVVNVDKDSRISAFSKDSNIGFEKDNTTVNVVVGTRVSDLATVATEDKVGVTYPDGSTCVSEKYVWVYDPVSDPLYPYVLVAKEDAPASKLYYHMDYGFEMMHSTPLSDGDDPVIFYANTSNNYFDLENFKNSKSAAGGMQFDIKMGSLERINLYGNNYVRYVVTDHVMYMDGKDYKNTVSADGKTLTTNADAYFILGGPQDYTKNFAHVSDDDTGYTRAKVVVLDFDFGTDSKQGYPVINTSTQARRTKDQLNSAINSFNINSDGTLEAGSIKDFKAQTLKNAGEWNHMTVVFYTDPALNNNMGIAYYYVNGEYFGYTEAYNDATQAYILGVRFNMSKTQAMGASFAFDNVSFKAYNDYLFDGERDASGSTEGAYLPDKYVTAAAARKYITPAYSVGGVPQDCEINEALKYAASVGKPLELHKDITEPQLITTDAEVQTNGYEFNVDPGSTSCVFKYDKDGKPSSIVFNHAYDVIKVNYYWYVGTYGNITEMRDEANYDKVEVGIGQTPEPSVEFAPYVSLSGTKFKRFVGWSTVSEGTSAEEMLTVTLSFAINQGDTPIYMYPIYEDYDIECRAFVMNEVRQVRAFSMSDEETTELYSNLKDGDILVLTADFNLTQGGTIFDNPDVDPSVTIDNDYTNSELETMKANSAKIAVDVNGYNWTLSVGGTIAHVSRNTTLTVYSSRPGGYIYSRGYKNDTALYAQRMFSIHGGTEKASEKNNVYNAHINIGTTTVRANTYPGSNLTVNGGVIVEGMVGDNSCSINVNNVLALRGYNDSSAMIMTRFYDGEIIIKDSIFVAPHITYDKGVAKSNMIDLKSYDVSSKPANGRQEGYENIIMTPYVLLENSLFINASTATTVYNIVENNGDYKDNVCLEYRNFITNGKINASNEGTRNLVTGGVAAVDLAAKVGTGYEKAFYYQPLTLNMKGTFADGESHIIAIQSPASAGGNTVNDNRYFYVVDYGYERLVPGNAIGYIVLPEKIEKMTGSVSEGTVITVNEIRDLEGNVVSTFSSRKYAIGANYINGYNVPDVELENITLSPDGTFKIETINGKTVVTPNYKSKANFTGLKQSLSLYTEFGLNLYVPATYADMISKVTSPYAAGELVGAEATYEGNQYLVYTVYLPAGKITDDVKFNIAYAYDSGNSFGLVEGEYITTCNAYYYCKEVLANSASKYTAADMKMTWYAVNYMNEACKYFDGAENAKLASLLENYASAKGDDAERVYEGAVENTNLSSVFSSATVKLTDVPAYVFIVKAGFAGEITVTTSGGTYTFEITESKTDTKLEITGMKAYELAETAVITATGAIGETAVSITDGQLSLATYCAYHTANANVSEASAAALDIIGALYDYVVAAAKYNNGTLAESEAAA